MSLPLYPQCPLSVTGFLSREARVPSGVVSLKGKMKLMMSSKWGPLLLISFMISSRHIISPPMYCSTWAFDFIWILYSPTFPCNFLYMSSETSFLEG